MRDEAHFKIFKKFSEHSRQMMTAIQNIPGFQESENRRELLTHIQKLNIDIRGKFVELNNIKSDLQKVIVFLRRFPAKKYYEDNGISELDYTKYHLEVFFHKVATGSDLMKLLVNVLFDLKIPNRNCNLKNIRKKLPEEHSGFIKLIEAYEESFEGVLFLRNKNSHEAKFHDEKFKKLNIYDNLYRGSKKFGTDINELENLLPQFALEFQIKKLRKERIEWVESAITAYETYTDKIIERAMIVYFEKYRESLKD